MAENIYSCYHYHKKCQEDRQAIEELAPKVMEAASNVAWGNVGDIKYTARTDVPNGGAWCDGATYAKEDYPDVYKLLTDGKLVSVDMTTFDSSVNLNGSCGFFGLDDTGFKVPLLKDVYLKAGREADEFGAESLPNIKGSVSNGKNESNVVSGAFYSTTGAFNANIGKANDNGIIFYLDASRSSSTYQDGAKVNPDHVKYRAYVVLFLAEKELSIVNWTNQLQSKTDASINQIEAKTDAGINQIDTKTGDGVSTLNNLANTYSKEIGYLSGVTSNIQTQLNNKASSSDIKWIPNYNATSTVSLPYTTPSIGFFKFRCRGGSNGGNILFGGVNVFQGGGGGEATFTWVYPVKKGVQITSSGTQASTFAFIPCS